MNMKKMLVYLLLFFSCNVLADDKTLSVAVNLGKPWAYYHPEYGVTGIDVEVIRTIFDRLGYKVEFHLLGYSRLIKEFNEGGFDFASPAAFYSDAGFLTQKYLPFKDVAISLKSKNYQVEKIEDLQNYRVIAYQHAKSVLGLEYEEVIKQTQYLELAEREVQIKLLIHDRTDLVIGERRLLTYIAKELYASSQLDIHNIFPVVNYGAIAKDKEIAERFDNELNKFILSGEFQKILDKWN